MPGSKPMRETQSAPGGERVVPGDVQKTRSSEGSVDGASRTSTEDLFPDNQLGSVHDQFEYAPAGLEALPEEDSEATRKTGREGLRLRGKRPATAHQRSMSSQAAREFAEDAMKGYDVE